MSRAMSTKERAAISKRMKAYWAKKKASAPTVAGNGYGNIPAPATPTSQLLFNAIKILRHNNVISRDDAWTLTERVFK